MDKKTTIKTVDADVLILSISIFYKLKDHLEELWIDFGIGKNRRFFLFMKYTNILGKRKNQHYHFFMHLQAVTRCPLCLLLAKILQGKFGIFLMKLPQLL